MLVKADPYSVYYAAIVAAVLDLPVNRNLGFAYIIPYNDKKSGKCIAQFQIGYKGFIQLAQRSGLFKTISATPIYEGQIQECNPLTGYKFDFNKKHSDNIIGYAGYFKLLNGFEKMIYHSCKELKSHGLKYSQSYKKGYGLWVDDFEAMAMKTIIKSLLSKYAPLSVTMQKAEQLDASIINNEEGTDFIYVDNAEDEKKEFELQEEINKIYELFEIKKDALTVEERKKIENAIKSKDVKSLKSINTFLASK